MIAILRTRFSRSVERAQISYFLETVTEAFALLVESAAAVPLTMTTAGVGTEFGAR